MKTCMGHLLALVTLSGMCKSCSTQWMGGLLLLLLFLGIKFQFISPACNQSTILTHTHTHLYGLRHFEAQKWALFWSGMCGMFWCYISYVYEVM